MNTTTMGPILKRLQQAPKQHKRKLERSPVYEEGIRVPPPDDGGSDMEMEVWRPLRKKLAKRRKEKGQI